MLTKRTDNVMIRKWSRDGERSLKIEQNKINTFK